MRRAAPIFLAATLLALAVVHPAAAATMGWPSPDDAVTANRWTLGVGFTLLAAAALVAGWLALRDGRRVPRALARVALVGVLAAVVAGCLPVGGRDAVSAAGLAVAVWLPLTGAAALAVRTETMERVAGWIALSAAGIVAALPVLDVVAPCARGALAWYAPLGYDPSSGYRVYGMGNEMAAVMVGGLLAGWALLAGRPADGGYPPRVLRAALGAPGAACLAIAAWPGLGANLGVLGWGGAALVVALLGSGEGDRPRAAVRWIAVATGVLVLAALLFAWWDSRGDAPTHIGRMWLAVAGGDAGTLGALAARRLRTSWSILTYSPASVAPVALAAVLLKSRLRPGAVSGPLLASRPALRAALDGVLWAMPLALLLEDSGIIVPALMMMYVASAMLIAALGSGGEGRRWTWR